MPHTGVSLARTRDRKWSQPVSARRSIRPTSWPAAFAAAPTDASPWSMKLASTLGRLLKLSKPGRAMPGKTRVTRIGGLLSLEERLQRACLGVPRERGGEAAVERVALVVADGGAEPGIGEASMDAVAVGEKEVHGLGHRRRARGWRLVTGREPQAGQLLDAEQLGEREHPVADRGRRVAGEVEDAGELYAERADECLDEVGDEDRLQQARAEQRQRRPRRVVGEERAEEEVDEAEASRPVRVADARYERRNAGPFCEGGDLRLAVALGLAVRSRRPAGARLVEGELVRPRESLRLDAAGEDEVAGAARLCQAQHIGRAGDVGRPHVVAGEIDAGPKVDQRVTGLVVRRAEERVGVGQVGGDDARAAGGEPAGTRRVGVPCDDREPAAFAEEAGGEVGADEPRRARYDDVPWHRVGGSKAHARKMRSMVAAVRADEVRTATDEDGKLTVRARCSPSGATSACRVTRRHAA